MLPDCVELLIKLSLAKIRQQNGRKRRRIAASAYSVCDFRQKTPTRTAIYFVLVCVCLCECAEHCYKLKQSQIHMHAHTHTQHLTTLVCLGTPFHPVSHVKCSSCISVIFNVFPFTFICAFSTLIFLAALSHPTLTLQHRVQRRITICSCCYCCCCCYCCGFTPLLLFFCGNIRFKLG